MRYFILALFAALLIVAPAASAAPVKVKPVVSVTAASKVGKNVKFTIAVTVAEVPKCTGKVTAKYKLSKKKSVSWSARYTGDSHICTAAINGKLAAKNYGKKLKFAIKFPGNESIKKFSTSKSLTLSPPPPAPSEPPAGGLAPFVYGPQSPGPWTMNFRNDPDSGFSFTIKPDRTVPAFLHPSNLSVPCAGGSVKQIPFNWANFNFGMGGQIGTVGSADLGQYNHLTYSVTWNFATAHTGTGHFSASGTFESPPSVPHDCSLSIDVDFAGGS